MPESSEIESFVTSTQAKKVSSGLQTFGPEIEFWAVSSQTFPTTGEAMTGFAEFFAFHPDDLPPRDVLPEHLKSHYVEYLGLLENEDGYPEPYWLLCDKAKCPDAVQVWVLDTENLLCGWVADSTKGCTV